ncbi:MAG: hypothetical protein ACXVR1_02145 [Solirubrobacteraceae bacterium]
MGGLIGARLAGAARAAFMSGMSDALTVAAGVVLVGVLVALVVLPWRSAEPSAPE